MFNAVRTLQRKCWSLLARRSEGRTASNKGQTALILVFIIAIALIIYAVSLNWARVAQTKTVTIIASNTAAANMASSVTSWGEQQLQTKLGGRPRYCQSTSIWVAIVAVIIIIIILIIIIISWGSGTPLLGIAGAATATGTSVIVASVALVLAIVSLALQVAVIQPGLTRLWNRMQQDSPFEDQVIEGGVSIGLQSAVTDLTAIADHFDMDTDGLWVDSGGVARGSTVPDQMSRFAYYYTMRLKKLAPVDYPGIDNFIVGLNELLYDNPFNKTDPISVTCTPQQIADGVLACQLPDHFALFDPRCVAGSKDPSPYCNPCCVPLTDAASGTAIRPKECSTAIPAEAACLSGGEYPGAIYPYQYDPFYENYDNTFLSFRENLGIDDENVLYTRNETNPSPPSAQIVDDGTAIRSDPTPSVFRKEDPTGYYTSAVQAAITPPLVSPVEDKRKGVFSFFWNMDSLSLAVTLPLPTLPVTLPIAVIPKADNVTAMGNATSKFKAAPTDCALNGWNGDPGTLIVTTPPLTPALSPKGFWWKPGADRYCSPIDTATGRPMFPYSNCSARAGSSGACNYTEDPTQTPTCGCTAPVATWWHEDPVDNLVYGLPEFILWSKSLIATDRAQLYKALTEWFPQAAHFIAPQCQSAWLCDSSSPSQECLTCNNELSDGLLIVWRNMLRDWVDLLDEWLYRKTFNDAASWCLPVDQTGLPSVEVAAMNAARIAAGTIVDRQNNTIVPPVAHGTLSDTVACLNFNRNNVTKLTSCQTECARGIDYNVDPAGFSPVVDACLNLPRSLIDLDNSMDTLENVGYQRAQLLQNCLNTAASGTCDLAPGTPCGSLPFPPPVTPSCTGFGPGQPFYDGLKTIRDNQFHQSNYCTPMGVPNTFQGNLANAITIANTQAPDFQSRYNYLNTLKTQAEQARQTFMSGYAHFNDFLRPCAGQTELGEGCDDCSTGGPAAQLICARKDYTNSVTRLSNFAIYGWQTKPVAGRANDNPAGYWHIVKSEAFAPRRCYGQCGARDRFPWVRTYTRGFLGTTRCYELTDTTGIVISRVTRYDESHDTGAASFANGQKIWNFRFDNPAGFFGANANNLGTACSMTTDEYFEETSAETETRLRGAFMIDGPVPGGGTPAVVADPASGDTNYSPACWDRVNQLLARGVVTTTCAQYYLDTNIRHMSLKFIKCDPAVVDAVTRAAATGAR